MSGNLSAAGTSVTSRALALVGAFDAQHRRLTLTELASRAELPVPTAHRLLAELVAWGALTRSATGQYVIGRRLWDLGLLAPVRADLVELASPYLQDLYGATLATVNLAVRVDVEALFLDRLRGHASIPVVSAIGSRLPLHATGVGKVLLAYAPHEVQAAALSRLTRVTPYTVIHPGQLQRQLSAVLHDNYATTSEEMTLGAASVAVPIRHGEKVIAALGVVVAPLKRNTPRLVAALQVAARGIERELRRVT